MSSESEDMHLNDEEEQHDSVHLIQSDDGVLAVGESRDEVERFLREQGLLKHARKVSLEKLSPFLQTGTTAVQEGSKVVSEFGLWLKLTPESAKAIRDVGLIDSGVEGVKYAVLGKRGSIKGWLSVQVGPGGKLTNPALIGGAAGLLAQVAKQQEAAELKALLVSIDGKLDQVLRNQRNDLIADIAGLEDLMQRALVVREMKGSIDATTWSQVDGATLAATTTLRKALGRINGLASNLESKSALNAIAEAIQEAQKEAQVWLSVVARCFKLLDEIAVLELDRVMVEDPESVNVHRIALNEFRDQYRDEVLGSVVTLMQQMDAAASRADLRQVFHRPKAAVAVKAIDGAKQTVAEIVQAIGLDIANEAFDMINWKEALKSPEHMKAALKEAGTVAAVTVVTAAVAAAGFAAKKKL